MRKSVGCVRGQRPNVEGVPNNNNSNYDDECDNKSVSASLTARAH